jgi:hypothetical protein
MPFNNAYEQKLAHELEKINRAHIRHSRMAPHAYTGSGMDLGSLIQLPMTLLSSVLGGLGGAMPEQKIMLGRNKATYSPEILGHGMSAGRRHYKHKAAMPRRHHKGGAYSAGAYSGAAYSAGASSGGRGPSAKSKEAAKKNPWLLHVAEVRRANPGLGYKQALKVASESYRK